LKERKIVCTFKCNYDILICKICRSITTLYIQKITDKIKLSINQTNLLKYFHATSFGPLWPSSSIYKEQNIAILVANLNDAMAPMLIVLSYEIFYI
jgi:hypothetical protein